MPVKLICFGEQKLTRHRIYFYGPNKKKVGGNINNRNMKASVVTSNRAKTGQEHTVGNWCWGVCVGRWVCMHTCMCSMVYACVGCGGVCVLCVFLVYTILCVWYVCG